MKLPKKPTPEPALPTPDEARRTNVLMEKMYSEFRTFGESLSIVRQRVDRMEPKLDHLTERVDVLESAVRSHSRAVQANTEAIYTVQADLKTITQRLTAVETKAAS
jgi:uncharacterized coiled-coil protein SlyX